MSVFESETPYRYGQAVNIGGGDWTATGDPARAVLVGVAGNIVGRLADDTQDVTYPVPAGLLKLRFSVIRQTGTTATGIVALF